MNRYWYRDSNWKTISAIIVVLVVLGGGALFLFGDRITGGSSDDPTLMGVAEKPAGEGREDVAWEESSDPIAVADLFKVDKEGTTYKENIATGEPEEPLPPDLVSDPNFTGGSFENPGQVSYNLYNGTANMDVRQSPASLFYINGIPLAEQGVDVDDALLRQLRNSAQNSLVSYGTFDGENDQVGAYVITDNGFAGSNYLRMYIVAGDKVLEVSGSLQDSELPQWARTLTVQ